MAKKDLNCSFCGKDRKDVEKLVSGPEVYICNECIVLSYNTIQKSNLDTTFEVESMPSPSSICKRLDDYIIGQDAAKELLSVSAYNHYKRIASDADLSGVEKSNILLLGNTGTGKTLFAKTLAEILNLPFAMTDATTLTETGYQGEDAESILDRLLMAANYDVSLAEKGIVYIDEIDKKAKRTEGSFRDISGEGVQHSLLRMIEGSVVKVTRPIKNKKGSPTEEDVYIDTSDILFICGGAFVGIETVVKKSLKRSTIGFTGDVKRTRNEDILKLVKHDHVIKFGMIPELAGRLPVIATLTALTHDELVEVLTDVKNNFLDQYKRLLNIDGIDLEFGDKYISTAAELAAADKTGTRALKGIVENSLINIMYRAPDLAKKGVTKVIFEEYPFTTKPKLCYGSEKQMIDKHYTLYRGTNELPQST